MKLYIDKIEKNDRSYIARYCPSDGCVCRIHWIGSEMLYEAFNATTEVDITDADFSLNDSTGNIYHKVSHRTFLILAIATSIDAMAVGFTLNLLSLHAWLACVIIAIITAGFGFFGVYLGQKSGTWLEDKAELLGGVVLIGIGLKIMFLG